MNDNYDKRLRKYSLIGAAFEKLVHRMVYALFNYGERVSATPSRKDAMERRAIARIIADHYRNNPKEIKTLFVDILSLGDMGQNAELIEQINKSIGE